MTEYDAVDHGGIYLGRYIGEDGKPTSRKAIYEDELHLVMFGPNGSGKGMRILSTNLLTMQGKSIVVVDTKGQLTAMTAKYRHKTGNNIKIIDPFGVVEDIAKTYPNTYSYLIKNNLIRSCGFNPLATLDPQSKRFYDDAAVIADALIKIEGNEPHWPRSARGLMTGLIMWERKSILLNLMRKRKGVNLSNVRMMLTEAEVKDSEGVPVKGLRATAMEMVAFGGPQIESLTADFAKPELSKEMDSVRSTARTSTQWILSTPMQEDLAKNGIDFRTLKTDELPTTVYIVLPADMLEAHGIWLRLVVSEALRASMIKGGRRVLMILDEFAALDHLAIVERLYPVCRDYRVQMWPILQDIGQLKALYEKRWETMLGMAGCIQSFRAGTGDMTTAEWLSKRCGSDTITALGYSHGSSQTNQGGGQSYGWNDGWQYQQVAVPFKRPENFFEFPTGYTICFAAGKKDPVMLGAKISAREPTLEERSLPNPYYIDRDARYPLD